MLFDIPGQQVVALEDSDDLDLAIANPIHDAIRAHEDLPKVFAAPFTHDMARVRQTRRPLRRGEQLVDPLRRRDWIVRGDVSVDGFEITQSPRGPDELSLARSRSLPDRHEAYRALRARRRLVSLATTAAWE